jgi:hypothetical protein
MLTLQVWWKVLVSKMLVFGHVGYLLDEDSKSLKLSVSISSLL